MLRKLLKHEFRATGRTMLPLYLILLVTSVGARLAISGLLDAEGLPAVFGALLMVAFVIAIFAVCIMSVVVMVQRFYKSLLQDEGYVMMTLPVSVHQHMWAKLITSAVWFALTMAAVMLACCILVVNQEALGWFFRGLGELLHELTAYYAINGTAVILEFLVLCFAGVCAMCLEFYAALAVGHSFPNHKMAWSVGAYFGLQFAMQFITSAIGIVLGRIGIFRWLDGLDINLELTGMAAIHIGMLVLVVMIVALGAVYYGVTAWFLKHKLNLE